MSIGVALGFVLGALAGLLWQAEKVNRLLDRIMRLQDELGNFREKQAYFLAGQTEDITDDDS